MGVGDGCTVPDGCGLRRGTSVLYMLYVAVFEPQTVPSVSGVDYSTGGTWTGYSHPHERLARAKWKRSVCLLLLGGVRFVSDGSMEFRSITQALQVPRYIFMYVSGPYGMK